MGGWWFRTGDHKGAPLLLHLYTHIFAQHFGEQMRFMDDALQLLRCDGLATIAQGIVGVGVNLNDEAIGSGGDAGT